jgi:GT2 family glycosyltransferase
MRWACVVLSWNGREDTLACLRSLQRIDGVDVICVDNGSGDGSPEAVRDQFPGVELIENGRNLGFAGGNNVGIARALERGADWVVLVNNDAEVAPDVFDGFEEVARAHPRAGILAGKVFFRDPPDVIWYAGAWASTAIGYSGRQRGYGRRDSPRYRHVRPTGRAVGALMAVSRACVERVGLLDEDLFAYVEDFDWSVRARKAGFEVLFAPDARCWHHVTASTGGQLSTHTMYYGTRNMIVVCERHRPLALPLRALRRWVVYATFAAHVLTRPQRRRALAAVREGYRDAVRGRLGAWEPHAANARS